MLLGFRNEQPRLRAQAGTVGRAPCRRATTTGPRGRRGAWTPSASTEADLSSLIDDEDPWGARAVVPRRPSAERPARPGRRAQGSPHRSAHHAHSSWRRPRRRRTRRTSRRPRDTCASPLRGRENLHGYAASVIARRARHRAPLQRAGNSNDQGRSSWLPSQRAAATKGSSEERLVVTSRRQTGLDRRLQIICSFRGAWRAS